MREMSTTGGPVPVTPKPPASRARLPVSPGNRAGDSDEQLGLFSAPTRLFTCTPSRLATYEDCPRRYRYTYLDRPTPVKGPSWAHNSLGSSVHLALRNWYGLVAARRTPGALPTLLRGAWVWDGYRDEVQGEAVFQRALSWLEAYVGSLPEREPLGVERTVAVRTEKLALSGRVDRIDERDDELVIVDYKTGRAALGSDDARGSRALALYAYASRRVFRRQCQRVELHHLPTGTVAAAEHSEESLARHLSRAEATAADAIAATDAMAAGLSPDQAFPTNMSGLCSWCDFRKICPVGRDAPIKERWAAVADLG